MAPEIVFHEPVMAHEAAEFLVTDPNGVYVDATVGGGGHSQRILQRLGTKGTLIGLDRDPDAIAHAASVLGSSVMLIKTRFSEMDHVLSERGFPSLSGVLFDLGVSSHQIDSAERGFSYRFAGPLDLRMDPTEGETAAELLDRLSLGELTRVLLDFGEDSQARRIARAIIRERERSPISTTDALANIISRSVPATRIKSLSRVFQALRMAVNHEVEELEKGLAAAWNLLGRGGRLVTISYHSIEDRLSKTFMKSCLHSTTRYDPILGPVERGLPARLILRKPVRPSPEEIERNPRARSSKLRCIEKL